MESVSDYSDAIQDEQMAEQTEIFQNGFSPEENNCDNCDKELNEKTQDTTETTSCPVIPKKAALLYPLKWFPLYCLFLGIYIVKSHAISKE